MLDTHSREGTFGVLCVRKKETNKQKEKQGKLSLMPVT